MRRKPITRDEIRFNGSRITTLPIDSVRGNRRDDFDPIPRLWAPLLPLLDREVRQAWDRHKWVHDLSERVFGRKKQPPPPVTIPQPYQARWGPCTCRQCGAEFYRVKGGSERYCSDRCANAVRSAKMVAERSEARAAARAGRTCINCGKPIEAQRSTRHTCSDRCRVAAHRAKS
jgi:predicted nucleic acid-binding Zn ribbon protein